MAEAAPETILCDTSYVGVQERGNAATAHWDRVIVARLTPRSSQCPSSLLQRFAEDAYTRGGDKLEVTGKRRA